MRIRNFLGEFSDYINNILHPNELILIDAFDLLGQQICSGDKDGNNVQYINTKDIYNIVIDKFKDKKNIKVIKSLTTYINNFDDNYFDLIYIDADHSYKGCKNDLELAFKKNKKWGIYYVS